MPNNRLAKESREELKGLDAAGLRAKLDESRLKLWQLQFSLVWSGNLIHPKDSYEGTGTRQTRGRLQREGAR